MIYLIAKILVYLLFALGIGAAAGWLWRHQQAALREAALERQLMDARSRLPQVETALRTREEQVEGLLGEVHHRDEALIEQQERLAARDKAVAELERACAELRQRLEQAQPRPAEPATATGDSDELELHPGDPEAAAAAAEPADPEPPERQEVVQSTEVAASAVLPVVDGAERDAEREALEGALDAARTDLEKARSALAVEQRRVLELTRERELQHRALAALEQQLELAREHHDRAANG